MRGTLAGVAGTRSAVFESLGGETLLSFEPDKIDVYLDDKQLKLEPGQHVVPHGIDRGLDPDEILHKNPV